MNFDHLKALVAATKSSEHLYEEQAAAIKFTTMFGDQLIAMAEAGQEIASCLELNKTRSGANPYIIPPKVVDLAKSLEDYDKLLKGEKHQYKSEHDLIEVKPKIVVRRWMNIIQYANGIKVSGYPSEEIASLSLVYETQPGRVLAEAVPFKWTEGGLTGTWDINGRYDQHRDKSEHDLIEVKPKVVIERWFNVVQNPDYGLYIEQYSTKDAAIAARQVHGDTIITKAIPFVWREP